MFTSEADPVVAPDYGTVREAIDERDAVAFVAVGDRFDDELRYLSRFAGPDRDYAVVLVPGGGSGEAGGANGAATDDPAPATDDLAAVLCAPALFDDQAEREFPGRVRTVDQGDPAGRRAARTLAALGVAEGTVLAPASIPHDAALYLEDAGYDLASTDAVARARETKGDGEIDRLRAVQAVAERGLRRAAAVLRETAVEDDRLRFAGEVLTTEGLRREVDAAMAAAGAAPADNTVVGAGESCADLHFRGDVPIGPDETVLIDASPRGPAGYHGDCTRTFVVDGSGGWERRAHVAVENAREAAFSVLEEGAGTPASTVHDEAAAEIVAYGFPIDDDEHGFTHSIGHGVGTSLHERPSTRSDDPLRAGATLTVEPGVYDPGEGGVRIEDLVVVREDGYENLTDLPPSMDPGDYGSP